MTINLCYMCLRAHGLYRHMLGTRHEHDSQRIRRKKQYYFRCTFTSLEISTDIETRLDLDTF